MDGGGQAMAERHGATRAVFQEEIVPAGRPVVLRGLVADWPAVAAARRSSRDLAEHLLRFDRGRPMGAMVAPPRVRGRFFYNAALDGFNFRRQAVNLRAALDFLVSAEEEADPPALAIQSARARANLPGFEAANPMPLLGDAVEARLWIGNRVTVAAHYDPSENIACVVAGRRRFTLFPPDQVGNLYMGPMERTPAGTTVSLVDFDAPDAERHPRFADAMAHALVADLGPGDAIYIPYLWWHHVRSLDRVNMLANYWWVPETAGKGHPMDAMLHAILSIRALPEAHRQAWRAQFDHYVFGDGPAAGAHLPPAAQGILGPMDDARAQQLAEAVMKGLRGERE